MKKNLSFATMPVVLFAALFFVLIDGVGAEALGEDEYGAPDAGVVRAPGGYGMYQIWRQGGSLVYYKAPDGNTYSLNLAGSGCGPGTWCCTASNEICYHTGFLFGDLGEVLGDDAALQFTLQGANSISCTLLHSEDDYADGAYYFSTDSGNHSYPYEITDQWTFTLRKRDYKVSPVGYWARFFIICFD